MYISYNNVYIYPKEFKIYPKEYLLKFHIISKFYIITT